MPDGVSGRTKKIVNENRQTKLIRKIWDVISPMVFIVLCLLAVTMAGLLAGGMISGLPIGYSISELYPAAPVLISLVCYLITIFTQRKIYKRDALRFGERKNRWSIGQLVISTAAAFGAAVVLNLLIAVSGLMELFPSYAEQSAASFAGQPPLLLAAAVVVVGPIAEELVFRGMTYERIRNYLGVKPAVIISSLMFGLWHGNVVQFVYAFIVGIILSVYYEKSGSLHACVLAHMAMNAFAVTSFIG